MQQYLFNLIEVYFDFLYSWPFWPHLDTFTVRGLFSLTEQVLAHCQKTPTTICAIRFS